MVESLSLEPGALTLETLRKFSRDTQCNVIIGPKTRERMANARRVVDRRIQECLPTYGVNTGMGALANRAIALDDLAELQRRLILSNAAGVGPLMAKSDVRCMMLLKAAALASGWSGARPELADAVVSLLNTAVTPCVPSKGSVGASGDLAPLAHVGAALMGFGKAYYGDQILEAHEALRLAGLTPFMLAPKEGLALVNGTQASTALAVSGIFAAETILYTAVIASMLTLEASLGQESAFDARLHEARRQQGQIRVAALCRSLLQGSRIRESVCSDDQIQDPYCLRCIPQVMGACYDQLSHAARILETEANAWTDNPMVDPDSGEIINGGNFHAEPVGLVADGIALALAEIGGMSERRIALLIDPRFSKLPAFLVSGAGLDCGFMVAQVTAAALASENKSLAHPATVDSIPTCANQEDFVSMATFAARRLRDMADNTATIVAIELLAAAQGLDLRGPTRTGNCLKRVHSLIRSHIASLEHDRFLSPEIELVRDLVASGAFLEVLPTDIHLR
jgi:histidine ammonia-lyase